MKLSQAIYNQPSNYMCNINFNGIISWFEDMNVWEKLWWNKNWWDTKAWVRIGQFILWGYISPERVLWC